MLSKIESKAKHGQASLQSFSGRLRISFPRSLFNGKRKYLYLNLEDTPKNRVKAEEQLDCIQRDIDFGQFDPSLERYRSAHKRKTYLSLVAQNELPTIIDIFEQYLDYLKPIRKETTIDGLEKTLKRIRQIPYKSLADALIIRNWLLDHYTEGGAKRILIALNAVCKWAIRYQKINLQTSPFTGLAKELKFNYEENFAPNAFNPKQKTEILDAFNQFFGKAMYDKYLPFVNFLFETGCRPSEAVGLMWGDIDPNFRYIIFDGGIVQSIGNKQVNTKGKGSKNNKKRKFPINERLRNFLQSLPKERDYLFVSPRGHIINYKNFREVWAKVTFPIKPDTTPYSCRDTFITEQIAAGVSTAIIAKWCDTSVYMIEKYYLDIDSASHILPS